MSSIHNTDAVDTVVARHARQLSIVIDTVAQPSHDWAADPTTDFTVRRMAHSTC
jgi:hypothetical protein